MDAKNAANDRFLQLGSSSAEKEFRKHQRIVKRAVDAAKEDWVCRVADAGCMGSRDSCGDWKDAIIVPILILTISLLHIAGKVFARIIQQRLQIIAEDILPDSQCGFRAGRGCTGMSFAARQLIEKCREHLFLLFVVLKKAYDSVPRPALWRVLKKHGVPPTMLSLIRSFHDGMKAEVTVGDTTTDRIKVTSTSARWWATGELDVLKQG